MSKIAAAAMKLGAPADVAAAIDQAVERYGLGFHRLNSSLDNTCSIAIPAFSRYMARDSGIPKALQAVASEG